MYRYIALGVAGVFLGFTLGWKTQGWQLNSEIAKIKTEHAQQLEKLQNLTLQAEQSFREKERSYAVSLSEAQEKRNAEISNINKRHADIVAGLRNRPERVRAYYCSGSEVPSPAPACAGTTGQELARGDAEFLAGYAADAARLDAALTQCQSAYEAVRKQLE